MSAVLSRRSVAVERISSGEHQVRRIAANDGWQDLALGTLHIVYPTTLRAVPIVANDDIRRQQARHANAFPGHKTVSINNNVTADVPDHFVRSRRVIDELGISS